MQTTFRKAAVEDASAVLSLLAQRHDEAHPGEPVPFAQNGDELFRQTISSDSSYIVVGEQDGQIVATLTVYVLPRIRLGGYFALIESVMVGKQYRGAGIGTELMKFAINECRKNKQIKKIKLGSRKDEPGVHAFYEKLGFVYRENLFQLEL